MLIALTQDLKNSTPTFSQPAQTLPPLLPPLMSQGTCNTVAQENYRPESDRTRSSWWLNLLRDNIQSCCPREDNNLPGYWTMASALRREHGSLPKATPKPFHCKCCEMHVCPVIEHHFGYSDTPAVVLKNCAYFIYDKHLNPWKRQSPALHTVMFHPAKKGHTYRLWSTQPWSMQ